MGHQIIRCPGGRSPRHLWNVWSTTVDDWMFEEPAMEEQLLNWSAKKAADDARRNTQLLLAQLGAGQAPYAQFAMTYEEAEETRHFAHGPRKAYYVEETEGVLPAALNDAYERARAPALSHLVADSDAFNHEYQGLVEALVAQAWGVDA